MVSISNIDKTRLQFILSLQISISLLLALDSLAARVAVFLFLVRVVTSGTALSMRILLVFTEFLKLDCLRHIHIIIHSVVCFLHRAECGLGKAYLIVIQGIWELHLEIDEQVTEQVWVLVEWY